MSGVIGMVPDIPSDCRVDVLRGLHLPVPPGASSAAASGKKGSGYLPGRVSVTFTSAARAWRD